MKIAIEYLKKGIADAREGMRVYKCLLKDEESIDMINYYKQMIENNKKLIQSIRKTLEALKIILQIT